MAQVYEGTLPYIFISYSHKDTHEVMAVVNDLERRGFRVWYDGGIEAGSEWPETIASHLRNAYCSIAFISKNYVNSSNCRRELVFAQNLEIPQLNVYLAAQVELSDGLQLQLGLNQSLWKNRYPSDRAFCDALAEAKLLLPCRQAAAAPRHEPPKPAPAAPQTKPAEEELPKSQFNHAQIKKASRRSSFPEILHIFLACALLNRLVENGAGFWTMFFLMILPHTLMALWARSAFRKHSKGLRKPEINEANNGPFGWWFFGGLIVTLLCAAILQDGRAFFPRLLTSIGLNITPGILSVIILAAIL